VSACVSVAWNYKRPHCVWFIHLKLRWTLLHKQPAEPEVFQSHSKTRFKLPFSPLLFGKLAHSHQTKRQTPTFGGNEAIAMKWKCIQVCLSRCSPPFTAAPVTPTPTLTPFWPWPNTYATSDKTCSIESTEKMNSFYACIFVTVSIPCPPLNHHWFWALRERHLQWVLIQNQMEYPKSY